MSACVYDNAVSGLPDNTIDPDGYALALTIDLPVMDTRAEGDNWEKYEDYVGTFSLLFFKAQKDGENLPPEEQTLIRKYGNSELTYFEVAKGEYGYMKQWYVRIPIDPTNDADFINTIRGNDFKIAVLANWPGGVNLTDKDNINTLHHLAEDAIYKDHPVYGFLTSDGRMGATTDWVTESYTSKDDANEWIIGNCESSSQSDDTSSQPDDTASEPSELDNDKAHLSFELKDPCLLWKSPTLTTGPITEETEGVFSFMAYASGTLSITAQAADGATITAQVGNTDTELSYKFGSEETTIKQVISITGDEQRVYIYSDKDDVEISTIEYIQDEYLYEMDRTGVKPSEEHPIPMYGVQKFGKLEDVWKEGTVFDLSDFNKQNSATPAYEGGPIQLLRSVAKVELLLPTDAGFDHVFLRSMNRTAYSEPMDVATNTSDIWKDGAGSSSNADDLDNKDCEWSKLIGLTPFYGSTDYQNQLSWYYGNWGKYNGTGSPVTNENDKFNTGDYPQILNPRIHRSEFVKFLKVDDEEYDRYVLYVPEKFVDDPTDVNSADGIGQSAPKVCHIEFRDTKDPHYNLDDNNCYRIYFTEGGFYRDDQFTPPTFESDEETWEKKYEQNTEILKKHWTIMRNHIYTFTVEYNPGGKLAVQVKVLPWKRRKVEVAW